MNLFTKSALVIALSAPLGAYAIVTDHSYDDIADSAYWHNVMDNTGLLIASLEEDGLAVFNDKGKQIQHLSDQEVVGVDVRYAIVAPDGQQIDIAAVALPDSNHFAFYEINSQHKTQPLREIGQIATPIKLEGVCLAKNLTTNALYVNGFSNDGLWVQYKLNYDGQTIRSAIQKEGRPLPVRVTAVGGKLSSCVVDDETATLYLAEQNIGIWQYGAAPEDVKQRTLLDVVQPLGALNEVESMDIVYQTDGNGAIIVADEQQGFVVYDRKDKQHIETFSVEGVEEAKLITVGNNTLWIGNTELEAPVYQSLSSQAFAQLMSKDDHDYDHHPWIHLPQLHQSTLSLVKASGETTAVDKSGDAADDPALWVNHHAPEKSLIIATNKKGGLLAYDLDGTQRQYIKGNKVNNVDIRQGVKGSDGQQYDIVAASNRKLNSIALYSINHDISQSPLQVLEAKGVNRHAKAPELATALDNIYGLCMGQAKDGTPYVYINDKNGEISQWRISIANHQVTGQLVRTLHVDTQPEGCVVDDKTQTLYVGEENAAIWAFDARENGTTQGRIFAQLNGENLVADIEGLTLYQNGQKNLLLASIQGNNSYAIFDLNQQGKLTAQFSVIADDNKGVDGSSDTDGIHATAEYLGDNYPEGVFIVQDWYNLSKYYQPLNQNFKIVDWRDIDAILK